MTPNSQELLAQFVNTSKTAHENSARAKYERQLADRGSNVGMINYVGQPFEFEAKDMSSWKTPQPPAPEGGGMSVMCTLMREYGYLEDDVFHADTLFGHLIADAYPEVLIGYHAWAKPLTEFLGNNAIYIPLFAYIVQAWAYEMAEQFGIVKNRSTFKRLVGKIVMNVGKPVCGFIGTVISSQGIYEYHRT
jgi:hypothetical protein